ncbi:MAG: phosphotransferase [bacterium]
MEKLRPPAGYADLFILAEDYFNTPVSKIDPLKGDGSDRSIYRIHLKKDQHSSIVGVIHQNVSENRDFFLLTKKFQETGLPVPHLFTINAKETAYLMQDLGPYTLAETVTAWNRENKHQEIIAAYQLVLDCLFRIQRGLPPILTEFLLKRKMDVSVYQTDLDYFKSAFMDWFGFSSLLNQSVKYELQAILFDQLSHLETVYFVYRDFQARNIMWLDGAPWFIDYQSAFLGPCFYDLASLLYGSKSGLNEPMRDSLVSYYFGLLKPSSPLSFERYQELFLYFVVLRRLRSLGSYGYLYGVKGKRDFYASISPTLKELSGLFRSQSSLKRYVHLSGMIQALQEIWQQHEETSGSS